MGGAVDARQHSQEKKCLRKGHRDEQGKRDKGFLEGTRETCFRWRRILLVVRLCVSEDEDVSVCCECCLFMQVYIASDLY